MSNELITRNGFISRDTSSIIGNLNVTGSSTFTGSISGSSLSANSINLSGITLETAWVSYAPIWSADSINPSIGDGTLTGFYKQIGKTVFVRLSLIWGSTTNGGMGAWLFSLPIEAKDANSIQFPCSIYQNSTSWFPAIVNGGYQGSTTYTAILVRPAGTTDVVSTSNPFTWAISDELHFNGTYEAV